jgi:RNA polymerase sigma-70 factor (ECF subfamily)
VTSASARHSTDSDSASGAETPSFAELVEANKKRVYYLALDLTGNHHDAEDLSQEVFIKALRNLDSFRGDAKPFTWLYRITVNTYLNKRRKKSVRYMELQEDFDRTSSGTGELPDADEQAERSQMQEHIEASLDALSPRERTAFVLKHYNDMAIKDVAAAMDVADGTVKSMLYRATRKLRDELAFYRDEL